MDQARSTRVKPGGDCGSRVGSPARRSCGTCEHRGDVGCAALALQAADASSPDSGGALARICEGCWPSVFGWVRRQGYSVEDAEDLTQAYFTRFLEKRFVEQFCPGGACFRPFLLVSVRHFVSNERDRERAVKRGGGRVPLSIEAAREDGVASREPTDAATPETLLEQRRARCHLAAALERLAAERGHGDLRFPRLYPHVVRDPEAEPYRVLATDWGVGESAVRVAVHRLRRRLARILEETSSRPHHDPGCDSGHSAGASTDSV